MNQTMQWYQSNMFSILQLPEELIARILYFVHIESYQSKASHFGDLLSMLYTCKFLYYKFEYMIYTLKPLILKNKSKSSPGKSLLKKIASNCLIQQRIRVLSIEDSVPQKRFLVNFLFKDQVSEDLILDNLQSLLGLRTLVISSHSGSITKYLLNAPSSLTSFELHLETTFSTNLRFRYTLESIIEQINLLDSIKDFNFSLQNIKITSSRPIVKSKIHSIFLLGSFRIDEDYDNLAANYFNSSIVRKFDKFNHPRKQILHNFGHLVHRILTLNKSSLKSIELQQFDFALIMGRHSKVETVFLFPTLKLLLIDNISLLWRDAWLAQFQMKNRTFRNGRPLFIVIDNKVTGTLMLKPTLQLSSTRAIDTPWSILTDPEATIKEIKEKLGIFF
ncbi:uncharacterized protein PRCAT00002966001 [Priceomyces carsonii]|uniref:uncharacterized protein n=1 Tax=Priceomyces carsonii TaxID=28549 RepID=UPI002ED8343E|nr:unnamed protein product [Priceomyces carsonii]